MLRPFRGYLAGVHRGHRERLCAALAAAVPTAVLRPSLPTAAAVLLDANQPGAGKGKLARALAVIASGRIPAVVTEGHGEEETEERIAAAVPSGAPCLLLDNLRRIPASSTLESGITQDVATIRLFRRLAEVTVPCPALVPITANDAALRPDTLRRTLPVRIVVDADAPETRGFDFDPCAKAGRDSQAIVAAVPTSPSLRRNAATNGPCDSGEPVIRQPTRRTRPDCCASAARGHAAASPTKPTIPRRLIHHLVGAGEEPASCSAKKAVILGTSA